MEDREAVYDAEIAPLMAQIIAVCKRDGIPMAATFQLNDGDEAEDGPLFCSTVLPFDGCDEKIREVAAVIRRRPMFAALTITTRRAE